LKKIILGNLVFGFGINSNGKMEGYLGLDWKIGKVCGGYPFGT